MFHGIVGKIEQASVFEPRLMLIREVSKVGELCGGHMIYKIKSIAMLNLASDNSDIGLLPCKKHQYPTKKNSQTNLFDMTQRTGFAKTWGTIKSATNTIKNTTQQAAAMATSQVQFFFYNNIISFIFL